MPPYGNTESNITFLPYKEYPFIKNYNSLNINESHSFYCGVQMNTFSGSGVFCESFTITHYNQKIPPQSTLRKTFHVDYT